MNRIAGKVMAWGLGLLAGTALGAEPPKDGLQLWLKPDGLAGVEPGGRIVKWMDSSGKSNDAVALNEKTAPTAVADAALGVTVARFDGKSVPGGFTQDFRLLRLPIAEEWGQITIMAVGRHLGKVGLFDTAPWENGCLRWNFGVGLTGAKLRLAQPFPGLTDPGLVALRISRDENAAATIKSYVNGKETASYTQPAEEAPARTIWFKNAGIGACNYRINNGGEAEVAFEGELAEFILYDRALKDGELTDLMQGLMTQYKIAQPAGDAAPAAK